MLVQLIDGRVFASIYFVNSVTLQIAGQDSHGLAADATRTIKPAVRRGTELTLA